MDIRATTFKINDYIIHCYFGVDRKKDDIESIVEQFTNKDNSELLISSPNLQLRRIVEKAFDFGNGYTGRTDYDTSHQPPNPDKFHLHLFKKGNELFAINRDGTAHDGCHGKTIPSAIFGKLKQTFPDFQFPDNRLIESTVEIAPLNSIDPILDKILCKYIDKMDPIKKNIHRLVE